MVNLFLSRHFEKSSDFLFNRVLLSAFIIASFSSRHTMGGQKKVAPIKIRFLVYKIQEIQKQVRNSHGTSQISSILQYSSVNFTYEHAKVNNR